MVFFCFVSYKSYHKKGTLDFIQRMVKELSELLLRKYHSLSTLMQTIHKQLYERRSSQSLTQLQKAFFSQLQSCVSITAMIYFHIILHPAVLIYDFIVFITLYVNHFTRLTELKFLI